MEIIKSFTVAKFSLLRMDFQPLNPSQRASIFGKTKSLTSPPIFKPIQFFLLKTVVNSVQFHPTQQQKRKHLP
jgi:hypothetical protein